jgi:hypothetical protein
VLSPETKWEIFLQVTSREITQADAARKWHVDVSTIIGIRRTVKDAAMAALSARPGRPATERSWELEQARGELSQLTEAVKAQAIELALLRGESAGPERPAARTGPGRDEGGGPQAGRRGSRCRRPARLGVPAARRPG